MSTLHLNFTVYSWNHPLGTEIMFVFRAGRNPRSANWVAIPHRAVASWALTNRKLPTLPKNENNNKKGGSGSYCVILWSLWPPHNIIICIGNPTLPQSRFTRPALLVNYIRTPHNFANDSCSCSCHVRKIICTETICPKKVLFHCLKPWMRH